AVERAEADRNLVALRPRVAEQARAADGAERLHATVVGPVDADQLLAGEQPEARTRHAALRAAKGSRVLAAARAVAVIGPDERRGHLEADAAAKAGTAQWVLGARLDAHRPKSLRSRWRKDTCGSLRAADSRFTCCRTHARCRDERVPYLGFQ